MKKKKVTVIIGYNHPEDRINSNSEIEELIKKTLQNNANPFRESIITVQVEDIPEPKIEVFSKAECIFQYCPHPDICRDKGCQCKKEK